jgi:hypothetical protein
MPTWLMKTADDTYREWSTVVDDWMSEPMGRDEAVAAHDDERVRFTDAHLCSCRARLGETIEIQDGRPIARGGGKLAYHFDSYEEVARFCVSQEELAEGQRQEEAENGSAGGGQQDPCPQNAPKSTDRSDQ